MPARKPKAPPHFVAEWPLSPAATLGSSVRAKGILQEVRARLPSWPQKRALDVRGSALILGMPEDAADEFETTSALVSTAIHGIETLPVLPREIEDILAIKTSERHRWIKDGRLVSAGTRTVKLRGRARKITFHVFDPRYVESLLEDDTMTVWREEDLVAKAENRRRALWKARLRRAEKPVPAAVGETRPQLTGWDEFEREGLLR
jgi:hypothetical protein